MSIKGYVFCMLAFLLIFGIVSAAFAGGEDFTPPEKQIECELILPADLYGWKQVPAEDRLRISEQVYLKKAKMQRRQTLLCRDVSGSKVMNEFVVWQWWYK